MSQLFMTVEKWWYDKYF